MCGRFSFALRSEARRGWRQFGKASWLNWRCFLADRTAGIVPGVATMATSSVWRVQRNAKALARLQHSLPAVFPPMVLTHALARPLVPPTPRRAVESYWRHHPVRADKLARALARQGRAPDAWAWPPLEAKKPGAPESFRRPPAPFRDRAYARGPGICCVCGQPVFRYGWHCDLWREGPNRRAGWHACCVAAWDLWTTPSRKRQAIRKDLLTFC